MNDETENNETAPVPPVDPEDPVDPQLAADSGAPTTGYGGFGAGLQVPTGARARPKAPDGPDSVDPHTPVDLSGMEQVPTELADAELLPPSQPRRHLGLMILAVVMGLVLLAGVIGVLVFFSLRDSTQPPGAVTSMSIAQSPTESMSASAFTLDPEAQQLLPATVGEFTLTSATQTEDAQGAKEAWTGEYVNASQQSVTVTTTVWSTDEQATDFATSATKVLPADTLVDSGILDGTVVTPNPDGSTPAPPAGTAQFWQFDSGNGVTTIVWTQGDRAVVMTGPGGAVQSLYTEFPF